VLGETWHEYRRHAARLLPLATAGIVVAGGATELVRLAADRFNPLVALLLELPAVWLVIKLVEFLLGTVATRLIYETRAAGGVQLLVENGIMYIVFIPAAVVLSTLIYYRLVASEAADEAVARAAIGT
jgi:hypothetical protein